MVKIITRRVFGKEENGNSLELRLVNLFSGSQIKEFWDLRYASRVFAALREESPTKMRFWVGLKRRLDSRPSFGISIWKMSPARKVNTDYLLKVMTVHR
jgi:hypothetical protein